MTKILAEDIWMRYFAKDYAGDEEFELIINCTSKEDFEAKKQQILSDREKAEKYDKKIQFWIDQGLSKEKAVIFTYDVDDAYLKEFFELEQQNKKLEDEARQLKGRLKKYED